MNRAIFAALLALAGCQPVPEVHTCAPQAFHGQACQVVARALWNDTGINLVAGRHYQFFPSGEWVDWWVRSDASGPRSSVVDALLLPTRPALHFSPSRDGRARYFSLIGAIGRTRPGAPLPEHTFRIEPGMAYTPPVSGRLYAFANDQPGAYGNNHGSITLLVRKLDRQRARPEAAALRGPEPAGGGRQRK